MFRLRRKPVRLDVVPGRWPVCELRPRSGRLVGMLRRLYVRRRKSKLPR
ncbi:MAG TPA: hypothetical protein VF950_21250 [Planctomycetota bacterium]